MIVSTLAFSAALVVAGALTPVIRGLARRFGAVDLALTSRKVHLRPIPRLGGIAILLGFYAPVLVALLLDGEVARWFEAERSLVVALLAGGLAIAAIGLWDDLRGARPRVKLAVQLGVAAFAYAAGFRIDEIANPFGPPITLGLLALPFTMLWIAGVINAMNLIDGLDGLAGGVALIALAATCALAALQGDALMVVVTATLAGATLGFLFYNFNPASIFMGDTGSMFLGFVLATTTLHTNQPSHTSVSLLVPVLVLGVPIADTLLSMARRAARGVPMFSADRGHIHHRLLDLGLSHRATVLTIHGASLVLAVCAVALAHASRAGAGWVLVALAAASLLGLRRLGYVEVTNARSVLDQRRRNLHLREEIRRIGGALRDTSDASEVWVAVRRARLALGASAIALHVAGRDDEGDAAFSQGFDEVGPQVFRARYSLLVERDGEDVLELGWSDGRTTVDRDTEIAVEQLCHHVSNAIARQARASTVLGIRSAANEG
jgi:UDP-GlcNAc:undecaprenyl-phosphate/decaprenyl-phosphate GlcNAc-1-phosphate transferase